MAQINFINGNEVTDKGDAIIDWEGGEMMT